MTGVIKYDLFSFSENKKMNITNFALLFRFQAQEVFNPISI